MSDTNRLENGWSLAGKVAVVTGGARGLGKAGALELARRGADVAILDILTGGTDSGERAPDSMGELAVEEQLNETEQLERDVAALGRRCLVLEADVGNRNEVEGAFGKVRNDLGAVDILVNNAAVFDHRTKFENQEEEKWKRDIQINLMGPFYATQCVWTEMKEREWGRIINMSSAAGVMGGFGHTSYSVTKAGIVGFTKSLALEGARYGIRVNAIAPGPIRTEAFELKTRLGIRPEINQRIQNATATRELGAPRDIANVVAFLASDSVAYLTGQVLFVGGGLDLFVF